MTKILKVRYRKIINEGNRKKIITKNSNNKKILLITNGIRGKQYLGRFLNIRQHVEGNEGVSTLRFTLLLI